MIDGSCMMLILYLYDLLASFRFPFFLWILIAIFVPLFDLPVKSFNVCLYKVAKYRLGLLRRL